MKRIVALMAVAWVGLVAGAVPVSAAAPYDADVAALLVAPTDPAFVESTGSDAAVGAITAESVPAMSAPVPAPPADALRGGFARLFTAEGRAVAEVGYDLGTADAAAAQAGRLLDVPAGEAPFEPLAIAGSAGLVARTNASAEPPYSFLAFASGPRFFVVTVTGPDAGHELLFRQAAAIGAAAVAAGVTAVAPVATATTAPAPSTTLAESRSFKARWNDVVQDRNTDRFLVVTVALLGLVLLNRAVNARRVRRVRSAAPTGGVRQSQTAWTPNAGAWPTLGTERFPASDEPAFPTAPGQPTVPGAPARTALGGPTAGADVLPIDAYTGSRTAGWGDEPADVPAPPGAVTTPDEPLPPLPSRARTPKADRSPSSVLGPTMERPAPAPPAPRPGAAPPPPAAAPAATPSPWTVSDSLGDEEHYSFPGAESWPGDPVGGGAA